MFPNVEVNRLESGSVFGEMSFLLDIPRTANVVVVSDYAIFLKLDGGMFQNLSPKTLDKVKDQFLKLLARRLEKMNSQVGRLKSEMIQIENEWGF